MLGLGEKGMTSNFFDAFIKAIRHFLKEEKLDAVIVDVYKTEDKKATHIDIFLGYDVYPLDTFYICDTPADHLFKMLIDTLTTEYGTPKVEWKSKTEKRYIFEVKK